MTGVHTDNNEGLQYAIMSLHHLQKEINTKSWLTAANPNGSYRKWKQWDIK
jgi:hypothetical protein